MRSVNKVILIGNLTRDPEMKNTTSGQSIVTFGLATNRQWTTSTGEKRTSAEFHECVVWARLAEICQEYLKKGMLVYVEGYLKTRSWDDESGTRRYRTEIVLQDMIRLEKRPDGEYEEVAMPYEENSSMGDNSASDDTTGDDDAAASDDAAAPTTDAPAAEETPAEAPAAPGELSADIDDDNMF